MCSSTLPSDILAKLNNYKDSRVLADQNPFALLSDNTTLYSYGSITPGAALVSIKFHPGLTERRVHAPSGVSGFPLLGLSWSEWAGRAMPVCSRVAFFAAPQTPWPVLDPAFPNLAPGFSLTPRATDVSPPNNPQLPPGFLFACVLWLYFSSSRIVFLDKNIPTNWNLKIWF